MITFKSIFKKDAHLILIVCCPHQCQRVGSVKIDSYAGKQYQKDINHKPGIFTYTAFALYGTGFKFLQLIFYVLYIRGHKGRSSTVLILNRLVGICTDFYIKWVIRSICQSRWSSGFYFLLRRLYRLFGSLINAFLLTGSVYHRIGRLGMDTGLYIEWIVR